MGVGILAFGSLNESVTTRAARAMLYRRETRQPDDARATWIGELTAFAGIGTCLYTALAANISPLTADKLADLAIRSAAATAGAERRDGICYLRQQLHRGIMTPLVLPYQDAVLARTGARDLDRAWKHARSGTLHACAAGAGCRGGPGGVRHAARSYRRGRRRPARDRGPAPAPASRSRLKRTPPR